MPNHRVIDLDDLARLHNERLGVQAIARELGCGETTVRRWLAVIGRTYTPAELSEHHRHVLAATKPRPSPHPPTPCKFCGRLVAFSPKGKRYCSNSCRQKRYDKEVRRR